VAETAVRNLAERGVGWLQRSWWIVFWGFAAVVLVFIRERACFDRLDLLPSVATRPALAWMLATLYLLAHCWLLAAYVLTVQRTDQLLPRFRQISAVWGAGLIQLLLMLALFALEYAPAGLWTSLGRLSGACGPGM
jgi:hypothetical protein